METKQKKSFNLAGEMIQCAHEAITTSTFVVTLFPFYLYLFQSGQVCAPARLLAEHIGFIQTIDLLPVD
ncbi:hypothetical protein [Pantoea agglomerans]|uniref:hypothetical protein n=1 Tax=Enterobacter agglomerans TaxID=549 RepID=UPI00396598A7